MGAAGQGLGCALHLPLPQTSSVGLSGVGMPWAWLVPSLGPAVTRPGFGALG